MARMTRKLKMFAYILNEDFGYTMSQIAELMNVSQPTISLSIKEIKSEILNTTLDFTECKNELINLGYKEPTIKFNK